MRVSLHADGVSTEQLRSLLAAAATVGVTDVTTGLDGPECWKLETPPFTPNQFARIAGQLVKYEGRTPEALIEAVQVALGELGEALMKDGPAKDACIERAVDLLAGRVTP